MAGRRFGKFIQTFAAFGQGISADSVVGVTTTTFSNGIASVWSSLLYLFATPLYWMVLPWIRRLRLMERKLLTERGRELYKIRDQTVETVLGRLKMFEVLIGLCNEALRHAEVSGR